MENHHFQWENPLFLWPFSISILNDHRVSTVSSFGIPIDWYSDYRFSTDGPSLALPSFHQATPAEKAKPSPKSSILGFSLSSRTWRKKKEDDGWWLRKPIPDPISKKIIYIYIIVNVEIIIHFGIRKTTSRPLARFFYGASSRVAEIPLIITTLTALEGWITTRKFITMVTNMVYYIYNML